MNQQTPFPYQRETQNKKNWIRAGTPKLALSLLDIAETALVTATKVSLVTQPSFGQDRKEPVPLSWSSMVEGSWVGGSLSPNGKAKLMSTRDTPFFFHWLTIDSRVVLSLLCYLLGGRTGQPHGSSSVLARFSLMLCNISVECTATDHQSCFQGEECSSMKSRFQGTWQGDQGSTC